MNRQTVGTIKSLFRYPVKSMVGESLDRVDLCKHGVSGDRCWALRDESAGEMTVVRKTPKLLECSSTYPQSPVADAVVPVSMRLPDGSTALSSDPNIHAMLSDFLGKPVTLWPRQPRSNWRHYRVGKLTGAKEMARLFGTEELPDLSSISWHLLFQLMFFTTPLGRYYDVYPLHLMTTNTLDRMAEINPRGDYVAQRFRPNIVIESAEKKAGFDEFAWRRGTLHIGDAIIGCGSRTVRCSMPAQTQHGLSRDTTIMPVLKHHTDLHAGLNATVIREGSFAVGDTVEWQPPEQSAIGDGFEWLSSRLKNKFVRASLGFVDLLPK